MKTVQRYEVPPDDQAHAYRLTGPVLLVDCAEVDREPIVWFWAEYDDSKPFTDRRFRVFRTGEVLPAGAVPVGSVHRLAAEGQAWHLYDVP